MNFSINKLNDASVLAVLECDTPLFKGLVIYPLPFMGDDDLPIVNLIKEKFKPRKPRDDDFEHDLEEIKDYHVIFNLTQYSETVVSVFIQAELRGKSGLLLLSCDSKVHDYMTEAISLRLYKFLPAPDAVREVFTVVDPMKIAKCATLLYK